MSPIITYAKPFRADVYRRLDRYREALDYFASQYILVRRTQGRRNCVIDYRPWYALFAMSHLCFELRWWASRELWQPIQLRFQSPTVRIAPPWEWEGACQAHPR